LGDYMAEKLITLDRLHASSLSGRWQEVISNWRQLPGPLFYLFDSCDSAVHFCHRV